MLRHETTSSVGCDFRGKFKLCCIHEHPADDVRREEEINNDYDMSKK